MRWPLQKREFVIKFLAGMFFLLGMAVVLAVIFTIGQNKGLTQPKFQVDVLFADVGGLIEGAPVQLAGVNVGTVADISFLDEEYRGRRVRVRLNIFSEYRKQMQQKVRFTIMTEGILGEKIVEIVAGDGGKVVDLTKPVLGEGPLNVQDMAVVFADAAESFTRTAEIFNQIDMKELSQVLSETASTLNETSQGINEILTELHYISIKTKRLLDRLEQRVIDGDLFKVF